MKENESRSENGLSHQHERNYFSLSSSVAYCDSDHLKAANNDIHRQNCGRKRQPALKVQSESQRPQQSDDCGGNRD